MRFCEHCAHCETEIGHYYPEHAPENNVKYTRLVCKLNPPVFLGKFIEGDPVFGYPRVEEDDRCSHWVHG